MTSVLTGRGKGETYAVTYMINKVKLHQNKHLVLTTAI